MALNTEGKDMANFVANFMYKVINRAAADDPGTDGKLTREGMKTALQQQLNGDAGSSASTLPFAW